MAFDPNIRASDADRDKTVILLREHLAAGRLTNEEFDERLEAALSAKTLGDLDRLMADLPGIDMYRLPDANLTRRPMQADSRAAARRHADAWRAAWGSWFTVSLVLFVIWGLSGAGYPWPLWIAGPWGVILLGRWISGSHSHGSRHIGPGQGGPGELPGRGPGGPGDGPGQP
jgi:Domain of unknown function (DUF1707)